MDTDNYICCLIRRPTLMNGADERTAVRQYGGILFSVHMCKTFKFSPAECLYYRRLSIIRRAEIKNWVYGRTDWLAS